MGDFIGDGQYPCDCRFHQFDANLFQAKRPRHSPKLRAGDDDGAHQRNRKDVSYKPEMGDLIKISRCN